MEADLYGMISPSLFASELSFVENRELGVGYLGLYLPIFFRCIVDVDLFGDWYSCGCFHLFDYDHFGDDIDDGLYSSDIG